MENEMLMKRHQSIEKRPLPPSGAVFSDSELRLDPGLPCPGCHRLLQPRDARCTDNNGIELLCGNCHRDIMRWSSPP
jgi:hypothetical protein